MLRQIRVHPLLWLVIALSIVTARFIELSIFLMIIFIHEMGHAVAASLYSWRIKRITLLPFGGVAEMDEHGNRPLQEEAIVILAGPLQHVWMIGAAYWLYSMNMISSEHFSLFFSFNLMVLLFNLLPIWPLDGGKLLFLLFSYLKSFPEAHRLTLNLSLVWLLLLAGYTLLTMPNNINMWIILAFLSFSLYHEWKQQRFVFMRFLLERYYGHNSDLRMLKPLKVEGNDLVVSVLQRFRRGCKHPIIIEENGKEKGTLDENEILHAIFANKMVKAKISDLHYTY